MIIDSAKRCHQGARDTGAILWLINLTRVGGRGIDHRLSDDLRKKDRSDSGEVGKRIDQRLER